MSVRFKELLQTVCEETDTNLSFSGYGYRYLNRFPPSISEFSLSSSLHGFKPTGPLSQYDHCHSSSDFWCEVPDGRLYVRTSTDHGSYKPPNMGYAEIIFDDVRLSGFDEMVTHLDIFESCRHSEEYGMDGLFEELGESRLRLSCAFLDSIDESMYEKLGLK